MADRRVWRTRDSAVAAALATLAGVDPVLGEDREGKITFEFIHDGWLPKTLAAYFSGEAVAPIISYVEKSRQLRGQMFVRRKAAGVAR